MGHSQAALRYAQCLRFGQGIARDQALALQWFGKASALLDAKLALGDMYFFGETGPARPAEAFRWYVLAAEQRHDAYAMYSAGYCLLHGVGTAPDVEQGLVWLEESAARGDRDAQYELAQAYGGKFTRLADESISLKWLRSAARLGHEQAQRHLDMPY